MSGKRRADNQVTRENLHMQDYSDEEAEQHSNRANEEVLAKRKILKPRSRLNKMSSSSATTTSTGGFSFGATASTTTTSTNGSSGFSFGAPASKPTFSFLPKAAAPVSQPTITSTNNNNNNNKPNKIKALNQNLLSKLQSELSADEVVDLSPILSKYLEYFKQIETGSEPQQKTEQPEPAKAETAPAPAPAPVAASDSDSDDDIKVEGPAFTLSKPPTTTDSVFKLSKETTSSTTSSSTGPSFTFANDKKFKSPFVLKPEAKKEEEAKEAKPTTWNPEKPVTFSENVSKPSFSFKPAETDKKDETSKPTFSFKPAETGKQDETDKQNETAKPSFSFGNTEKPAFSFGKPAEDDKEKPNFGSQPAFSFNAPAATSETPKPAAFSFGSTNSSTETAAKPSFSFGTSSTSTDKPAFSFGSTSGTTTAPAFSFGSAPIASTTTSTTTATESKDDEDKVEEVEVEGNFKPVVELNSKIEEKTGEEDEQVLYTKRAKISEFIPSNKENPYKVIGVGELKVLKNSTTNKSRILVRSDGANRVLLNILINKDFKYESIGKGDNIRIPTISSEGKFQTFIARVKTAEDGANLLNSIKSV